MVGHMRMIKYGHACVRIERDGAVLVIDPGMFTEPEAVTGADAVLITHEHADHLDVERLAPLRGGDVAVYTHPDVVPKLADFGDAVHAVTPGEEFTAAGFQIRAYGGQHAVIHPDLPRIANLGFLVDGGIYHPGDALAAPDGAPVDTLLLPISAPWSKLAETIDFARAVAPRQAIAIHDFLLSQAGAAVFDRNVTNLANCEYAHLPAGSAVEL